MVNGVCKGENGSPRGFRVKMVSYISERENDCRGIQRGYRGGVEMVVMINKMFFTVLTNLW